MLFTLHFHNGFMYLCLDTSKAAPLLAALCVLAHDFIILMQA